MPYVNVDIDLDEFDTQDLIDEIESRGLSVDESLKDDAYSLYRDFIMWDTAVMHDSAFLQSLKQFFLKAGFE